MKKEMTKIVIKKCQDCGNIVQILTNESAQIQCIRCPSCYYHWTIANKKVMSGDGVIVIPKKIK